MTIASRYLLIVSMDVEPEYEALFNEVYDQEHVPYLMQVEGVHSVSRAKGESFDFAMGGAIKNVAAPVPAYIAMYEIDDPAVVASDAWAEAVETGRWATEVRPHTTNRHHAMYKVRASDA
ncbi:MAG: hypothetical protein KTR33_12275 [Gammaproteobacteria bacterium]|nr:hypothetical protein [Gammaproteobacteria bacterium]